MRCEFCGHLDESGAKFCANCGARFTAEQPAEQPPYQPQYQPAPPQYQPAAKTPNQQSGQYTAPPGGEQPGYQPQKAVSKLKSLPVKKILMIGIPVIVVIIAAIIIAPLLGTPGSSAVKSDISFFTDNSGAVVSGDNNPKFSIDGDIHSVKRSMDGSRAAALIKYNRNTGGELLYVTTSASYHIADDVMDFWIADSGNGIAYLTDYDSRNDVATLFLYDTSAKSAARITDDALYFGPNDVTGICISPNGKSLSYISDYNERDDEFTGYIKLDGKPSEKLGKDTFVIAISDGGRHLYYAKKSDGGYSASLHVRSGRNDTRIVSDVALLSAFMLNKDYSEVLFTIEDRTFLSRNGGERDRVSGSTVVQRLILPQGTQIGYGTESGITIYGIRSFSSFIAYTSDGLVYVSNLEANRISGSSNHADSAVVSADGKTLLFINNNGHLSSIDPTRIGAERREVAKDVKAYVAATDAKMIYYVNADDELWCVKGSGAPVKISDDVSPSHLALPYSSSKIFFLVDYSGNRGGELYYSNNGGRRARISNADEIMSLWSTPANIFYVNRVNEIFRSNGNENFSLFGQGIDRLEP